MAQRVSKRARSAPTRLVAAEEEAPAAKKPRAPKAAPTSLKAKQHAKQTPTKTPTKAKTKKTTKKTTATKVKAKVATARVRAAKQVRRSHWTCG